MNHEQPTLDKVQTPAEAAIAAAKARLTGGKLVEVIPEVTPPEVAPPQEMPSEAIPPKKAPSRPDRTFARRYANTRDNWGKDRATPEEDD